jgi:hypothetical protein
MKKSMTAVEIAAFLVVLLLGASCLGIQIRQGVRDADRYFDQARREIRRIEDEDPGRQGRVHQVCVLVHDRNSQELVEISTPLWMANACLDLASDAADHDWDHGLKDRYGLDLGELRDLRRFGPGLLVDINDRDSRVLVWLR